MDSTIRDILDALAPALNWLASLPAASWLGGLTTLLGLGLLIHVLRARHVGARAATDSTPHPHEALIKALQARLEGQDRQLHALTERVVDLEGYLEVLSGRQERMEEDKKDPRFYRQLLELADKGTPAAELARRFGISASEAALITAMHRRAG